MKLIHLDSSILHSKFIVVQPVDDLKKIGFPVLSEKSFVAQMQLMDKAT
jgi:hypothetical protein